MINKKLIIIGGILIGGLLIFKNKKEDQYIEVEVTDEEEIKDIIGNKDIELDTLNDIKADISDLEISKKDIRHI